MFSGCTPLTAALVLVAISLSRPLVHAFVTPEMKSAVASCGHSGRRLLLFGSVSKWNDEYKSADDDDDGEGDLNLITNEMFLRDALSDTAVRRKRKGSKGYRPHDNRDALPFVVRVKTPDPYTSSKDMLQQAKRNSDRAATNGSGNERGSRTGSNLVGMESQYANAIAASIYSRKKDGSLYKVLGQFELDKNTNCGDVLRVGDREFEVVTARSQFKYAGGRKFVMVRKILEVKEIGRIAVEAALTRLIEKGSEASSRRSFE